MKNSEIILPPPFSTHRNKFKSFHNLIKISLICLAVLLMPSCGGGGSGGGMVSFSDDRNMPNNGGGGGSWGTGIQNGDGFDENNTTEEEDSTLLIGRMPALNVTNVNIVLYVNNKRFEINNVDETTTTSVLPKISISDTVSGTAYIYVAGETSPREAPLEPVTIGINNSLKFKVPYHYECIDHDTSTRNGTYYYADGIDLSDLSSGRVAGWLDSNGTMHYGSYINNVRGDITLTSVYKIAMTSNVTEISKQSDLITSLGISQDTAGTLVKPATAQLSVYGSSNYSYSSDAPSKIDISPSGVVTVASSYTPPLSGEDVTITVTDNDDATLFETVTLTLYNQCLLALYKDQATLASGAAPDYMKIFGGTNSSDTVSLNTAAGNDFKTARIASTGNTAEEIIYWKQVLPSPTQNLDATASVTVTEDIKAYAGWKIFASPASAALKRFTGIATDYEVTITSSYPCVAMSPTGGFSFSAAGSPGAVKCTVSDTTNLNTYDPNASNGVYTLTLRFKDSYNEDNYCDVTITVTDPLSVDASGAIAIAPGTTISGEVSIPSSINGVAVTKIPSGIFQSNTNITKVTVTGAITIESDAFKDCSSLSEVTLTGIKDMGAGAFKNTPLRSVTITSLDSSCTSFGGFDWVNTGSSWSSYLYTPYELEITIPRGVTSIHDFAASHFKSLGIPSTVTSITPWTFDRYYGDIYFEGTAEEWNAMMPSEGTSYAVMHYNEY